MKAIGILLALGRLAASPEPIQTFDGHSSAILSVAISRNGKTVATGSADKIAKIWNVSTGEEIQSINIRWAVSGIALTADAKQLLTGSWGGQIWESASARQIVHLESHTGFVTCLALSPDDRILATGGLDGTAKLFDTTKQIEIASFTHGEQLNCLALSVDGKTLFTAGDTSAKLWHLPTRMAIASLALSSTKSASWSSDGTLLAIAGQDNSIRILDGATGKEKMVLKGHTNGVKTVVFAPEGNLLASGSVDKTIRFWRVGMADSISIPAHDSTVNCLAFSNDGKLIVSGGEDKTAKLWKVPVDSK